MKLILKVREYYKLALIVVDDCDVNSVQTAEFLAPGLFGESFLSSISHQDADLFLPNALIEKEKAEVESKLGFKRVEVTGAAHFTLLFAAVVKEEDIPTSHRRYGRILVSARVVEQLAVDRRDYQSGNVVTHSMLHL